MASGGNCLGAGPPEGKIPNDAVRAQLERMMRSRSIAQALGRRAFLRCVAQQKHAGPSHEICAEPIRQRLYPEARGHDPDVCVRAGAGRLRNILDRYYKDHGLADGIRVSIPVSTYEPDFTYQEEPPPTQMLRARDALRSNIRDDYKEITPWNKTGLSDWPLISH
jgi:hypothetical protein